MINLLLRYFSLNFFFFKLILSQIVIIINLFCSGMANIQLTNIETDKDYSDFEIDKDNSNNEEDTINVEDIDTVPAIPSISQSCSTDPMIQNDISKSGKRKLSPK